MEVKYLRLVKNIVELGSIAKSKDKLCLTQSALSHQLKEAENQAGTSLFIRMNKKLILTSAGDKVYHTAIDVLEKLDNLNKELCVLASGEKGIIRLCTSCYTNYYWLPQLLAKFEELHPHVEIKIYPEYINEALPRLLSYDLDAVITNKPEICKGLQFNEIVNDELIAIVPKNHAWTTKKFVKASDFEGKNLIVFSKPKETVIVYTKVLKPKGIEPIQIYEVPMTEAMVEMVNSEMGVAVIPYWIARPYIQLGKVAGVRVTPEGLKRSLGIVFIERKEYPPYYNTLIQFLKKMFGEYSPD